MNMLAFWGAVEQVPVVLLTSRGSLRDILALDYGMFSSLWALSDQNKSPWCKVFHLLPVNLMLCCSSLSDHATDVLC